MIINLFSVQLFDEFLQKSYVKSLVIASFQGQFEKITDPVEVNMKNDQFFSNRS